LHNTENHNLAPAHFPSWGRQTLQELWKGASLHVFMRK